MESQRSRYWDQHTFDTTLQELHQDSPAAEDPPHTTLPLKPNQRTLLKACIDLERTSITLANQHDRITTSMGVIAEKVAGGKSIIALALIMSDAYTPPPPPPPAPGTPTLSLEESPMEDLEEEPDMARARQAVVQTYGMNTVLVHTLTSHVRIPVNVIVIPHTLAQQWSRYVTSYTDTEYCPYLLLQYHPQFAQVQENEALFTQKRIVIVTNTLYNTLASWMLRKNFRVRRILYDEADSLNIVKIKEVPADFYWFITASYCNLLYPRGFRSWNQATRMFIRYAEGVRATGFIKSLFLDLYMNMPSRLVSRLFLKNEDQFVDSSFHIPEPQVYQVVSNDPGSIHVLAGVVEPQIIDALNAEDVQTAIRYIHPTQRMTEDGIIQVFLQQYESRLTNLQIERNAQLQRIQSPEERDAHLQTLDQRIQVYQSKLHTIRTRVQQADMCVICHQDEGIVHKTILRCCGSCFCFQCIHTWLARSRQCPLCKEQITQADTYVVEDTPSDTMAPMVEPLREEDGLPSYVSRSMSKMRNLINILRNRPAGSKFLIFSTYDNTIHNIALNLSTHRIQYQFLKGPAMITNSIVRRYREESLDVLLVKTQNYGHGMNLENTTDVVMFHKFNNDIEKQVMGRAQREGRPNPLQVWYLLHQNEVTSPTT